MCIRITQNNIFNNRNIDCMSPIFYVSNYVPQRAYQTRLRWVKPGLCAQLSHSLWTFYLVEISLDIELDIDGRTGLKGSKVSLKYDHTNKVTLTLFERSQKDNIKLFQDIDRTPGWFADEVCLVFITWNCLIYAWNWHTKKELCHPKVV